MNPYAIIMFIFGIVIFLVGISIYKGNDTLLIRGYYKKGTKAYLRFVGRTTMTVSLSPVLSAISSIIIDNTIIAMLVLIISAVICFYISIKIGVEK